MAALIQTTRARPLVPPPLQMMITLEPTTSILVPYGNESAPWSSDFSDFNSMMKNMNIPIIEDEGLHINSKSSLVFDGLTISITRADRSILQRLDAEMKAPYLHVRVCGA
ncbi:unnamed protein product [Vicia faba]|uniref:Uncharacterized protein n=1 Tax=Vicia faba TaxID=3906 RepID=A0AAV0ZJZ0_VICFA|nr:unnamed protein product [Vicia faba]